MTGSRDARRVDSRAAVWPIVGPRVGVRHIARKRAPHIARRRAPNIARRALHIAHRAPHIPGNRAAECHQALRHVTLLSSPVD
jgi:hypothetical protein